MCFFTSQSKRAEEIARRYGRKMDIVETVREILAEKESKQRENKESVNLFRTRLNEGMYVVPGWAEPYSVIVSASDQLIPMQWGLIPANSSLEKRDFYIRTNRYRNAQGEHLFSTWPWKTITHNRCIIPITGFFESYHKLNKIKQPYYIERMDKEIFSVAGLYDEWKHPQTGESFLTFVIITVPATHKLRKIHNGGANPFRMPLILNEEKIEDWLNPEMGEEEIKRFLVTPDIDDQLTAWPVRKKFDRANPYDSSIIDPIEIEQELFSF